MLLALSDEASVMLWTAIGGTAVTVLLTVGGSWLASGRAAIKGNKELGDSLRTGQEALGKQQLTCRAELGSKIDVLASKQEDTRLSLEKISRGEIPPLVNHEVRLTAVEKETERSRRRLHKLEGEIPGIARYIDEHEGQK